MWIWVPDNTSPDTIRSLGGFAFTNPQVIAEFDQRFGSFVQQQQQQNQQTQYPQHPDYTVANRSVQQPQTQQQQNGGIGPNTVIAGQQGQPIAQVQTAQAGWNPNNAQVQYEWMYSPAQGGFTGVRTYNLNDNTQQQVQLPSQEMDNSRVRRGADVTGQPFTSSAQTTIQSSNPTTTTTATVTPVVSNVTNAEKLSEDQQKQLNIKYSGNVATNVYPPESNISVVTPSDTTSTTVTTTQLPENYSNDQYNMAPLPRVEDELERLPTVNNIPSEQLTLSPRNGQRIITTSDGRQYMVKTRIVRNPITEEDVEIIDQGSLINIPSDILERILARLSGSNRNDTNYLDVGN